MFYEILRWFSLAILWGCIGLQVWTIVRTVRINKRLEAKRKYYETVTKAYREFLEDKESDNETDAH